MKSPVYIFRGSPAAGKGTLVPLFCKTLPQPVALIEHDVLRWRFHKVHRTFADVIEEEHSFAFRNLLVLLEQYLKNDQYHIVLEGLFTWNDQAASQGNMQQLLELVARHNRKCVSIVLTANKKTLQKRNALRPHTVPKAEFDMLYTNVYKLTGPEEIIVDTTKKTIEESLELLHDLVPTD